MGLFSTRRVRPLRDGRFAVTVTDDEREVLRSFLEQLRDLLMGEDPLLGRLFPPAYLMDDQRDAEYQRLMKGELLESRFAAIEDMEATLDREVVDEATLTRWMQSINALRLVVGTRIDADETPRPPDRDDPDYGLHVLYDHLGWMLGDIVAALTERLPPPTADIDV